MRRAVPMVLALLLIVSVTGFAPHRGPLPQATPPATPAPAEQADAGVPNLSLPPGYAVRLLAEGLDFPTAITNSSTGVWVSESGHTPQSPPKVKRIAPGGDVFTILSATDLPDGTLLPPLTDLKLGEDGWLWIAHRQRGANGWSVGAVSKFRLDDPTGTFTTVIANLPSAGDYPTGEIVITVGGRYYLSQGAATNSGIVGVDNLNVTGWLDRAPAFHDFPATDVVLSGVAETTPNPLTASDRDRAVTSPFSAFGSGPRSQGTVVRGASPLTPQEGMIAGNGAVYSFDPNAPDPMATLQLEAWGLRNPVGIAIDSMHRGRLLVANNGAAIRSAGEADGRETLGSRPIANDRDDLFSLDVAGRIEFFGWPDFFHDPDSRNPLPVTAPLFCDAAGAQTIPCPSFVFDQGFRNQLSPQPALAQFSPRSSVNKFDVSMTEAFGHEGDIFVAETARSATGGEPFAGNKVVRVDRETGSLHDFIVNTGVTVDQAFDPRSLNRPVDVKFRGEEMLVVDFGAFEPASGLERLGTGKVWVVDNQTGPTDADGSIIVGSWAANYYGAANIPSNGVVEVQAKESHFEPTVIHGRPGQRVTIRLTNAGSRDHTFTIDGQNIDRLIPPRQRTDIAVTLPSTGTTRFYCRFHGDRGMAGALQAGQAAGTPIASPRPTPAATPSPAPR